MDRNNRLEHLKPEDIQSNPDNPRLFFRDEELDDLMSSIKKFGVQVPITVYEEKSKFYLIDGERRWRCIQKLNQKEIPAIIQPKPDKLENLLLMSNIHALREQWDYYTIALNLEKIIDLYQNKHNSTPNEIELHEVTGLTRGKIRRCNLILNIPSKYREILHEELKKPKAEQAYSEDVFLEMEGALKTVTNRFPEFKKNLDETRDVLLKKYKNKQIKNIIEFRLLPKIATSSAKNIGISEGEAKKTLSEIFTNNNIGIEKFYDNAVSFGYEEQKASKYTSALNTYFGEIIQKGNKTEFNEEFINNIRNLSKYLKRILGD